MADNKKKTSQSNGKSSSGRGSGKSGNGKSGNASKSGSRSRSRKPAQPDPAGIIALAISGVLFIVLAYLKGEGLWASLRGICFGVLGVSMYFFGAMLCYMAWARAKKDEGLALYLQGLFLVLIISALPIAFSKEYFTGIKPLDVVIAAFKAAKPGGWHGGVVGSILGATLTTLCGHAVACVLLILLMVLGIYLFLPVSAGYIFQLFRRMGEDGRERITDTRERRAESARRSMELQQENDMRRAARKEREAALAMSRRQKNVDIDLGPDPTGNAQPAIGPAAVPNLKDILSGKKPIRAAFDVDLGEKEPAPELPIGVAQPQSLEIGPGGTFGMNPLRPVSRPVRAPEPEETAPPPIPNSPIVSVSALTPEELANLAPHPGQEPDISEEIGGEFDTLLDVPQEPQAVAANDSDLWATLGNPDVIMAELPPQEEDPAPALPPLAFTSTVAAAPTSAPAAPAPAPAAAPDVEVERLIHKATLNGSMSSEAEATLEQKDSYSYNFPPIDILEKQADTDDSRAAAEMRKNADILVNTLDSFGVKTSILDICRGPSVTRYELQPQVGVKISRITSLSDDIALNLAKAGVRIEAPIPGKPAVGIEVPNDVKTSVSIRGILESQAFVDSKSPLTLALGKDIDGTAHVADLCKMPHLLIAGSTGSGKSVCVNSIIMSFLYRSSPEDVKLILIDPKVVELAEYNGIPHLLMPVVTEPRKAAGALGSAVAEMERRYHQFAENNVREIKSFNKLAAVTPGLEKMPYIVIIIDELADLMMVSGKEVEDYICRIAQKARAAGMHLIVATQRPSVDVITGLIKANIPSRIAFAVSSQVDSRTILDGAGAEKLLGMGDMLFLPVGAPKPVRIQGTFVKDEEITSVLNFVKSGSEAQYDEAMIAAMERMAAADSKGGGDSGDGGDDHDPMFDQAVEAVIDMGMASTSMLQRKCKLGYARAARIMDEMEQAGVIGPYEGAKPRQVLISRQQWIEQKMNAIGGADEV